MGEMTANTAYMYDEVEEIRNLNKVEGFDPRKYMRVIPQEGQAGKYYLDVAFRKLWFRLKYPEGKIVKKILKLTDQVAIVEARVYLNRNDDEDNFISNALAQKYMTADGQFGNKFVELAETAAVGRALSDAGFGLQFADKEDDMDPEITEAPFDAQMILPGNSAGSGAFDEMAAGEDTGEETDPLDENIPGQYGIEAYIPMPVEISGAGMPPAMSQNGSMEQQKQSQPQPEPAQTPAAKAAQPPVRQRADNRANSPAGNPPQGAAGIKTDMPVEQIYSMLNRDSAAAVVIPMGFNKGKTLGQVAVEKPANLQWFVDSYGGPNNLLRAAAKFLIDAALGQAS